jgi:hypothetical protein
MTQTADPNAQPRGPDDIRRDIERTRAELGQTLDALSTELSRKAKKTVPIVVGGTIGLIVLLSLIRRLRHRKD